MEKKKLNIHFAPLQGYTDHIYRNAHNAIFGGVDTYYTPFVRIERDDFRSRELRDIDPENNEGVALIPQLIATTAAEMDRICDMLVAKGYDKADINMGCPFPMIARKAKGSGILAFPEKVSELMDVVKKRTDITFSVKMRIGWETAADSVALVDILNSAPLSQIAIHARLGKQQYKGEVDMKGFEYLLNNLTHPVIYNGDITTVEQIYELQEKYPNLAGIMIGRGLLANPALGYEYKNDVKLSAIEMKKKVKELHNNVFAHYSEYLQGDKQILEKMKHLWEYFTNELEKRTRKKVEKAGKILNYDAAIALSFSQWRKVVKEGNDYDDSFED